VPQLKPLKNTWYPKLWVTKFEVIMTPSFKTVAPGLECLAFPIVNVYIAHKNRDWFLIDAGLTGSEAKILKAVDELGLEAKPLGIILTHGHFDHVGGLEPLLERWDVPLYAHSLELPYLQGQASYPLPNPAAGGLVSVLSTLFPRKYIDFGDRVRALDGHHGGDVPLLSGWTWFWTAGHSPGHISLWRESDRALVAGDAVTTTKQGSLIDAILKPPIVSGPPPYFTPDWDSARASAIWIDALEPDVLATGHGVPMHGESMREELHDLVGEFNRVAVPVNRRRTINAGYEV
jgi:glyoxylase-like metal-dependent hydrolase (beta-lactamase superfamily II)